MFDTVEVSDILQLVCFVVSLITSLASFVSSDWVINKDGVEMYRIGLWTQCYGDQCEWFLQEGCGLENHLPGTIKSAMKTT